jgi:hypothetical protein
VNLEKNHADCGTATPLNCDTSTYTGPRSQYTITTNPNGSTTVVDTTTVTPAVAGVVSKGDGTDTLFNIEQLQFSDGIVALTAPAPATVPGAPTIGTATAGNARATVTFTAPASDGGSPITGFSVQPFIAGVPAGAARPAGVGTTSVLVDGLTNGTAYQFQVSAVNVAGTSSPSAVSNTVTPAAAVTVPGAPAILGTPTRGNGSAIVAWTAPVNGGSPITGYSVRVANAATNVQIGTLRSAAAGATSLTVTGLTNGTAVQFQVQATNAAGTGAFSVPSAAVTPAAIAGVPLIGAPTRGNTSATARWTASAPNGSAITGYTVRVVNAANAQVGALRTAAAGATSLVVTGLTNGTAYRFQVRATNGVGTSAFSALSVAVTPATTPGAPVIGAASSGGAGGVINATARWTPPAATGGSPITGYRVTAIRLNAAGTVLATTVSAVQPATGRALTMTLSAGNYRFIVQAINAVGAGSQSARSNLVTAR